MKIIHCIAMALLVGCTGPKELSKNSGLTGHPIRTSSGLEYVILRKGSGEPARAGQHVLIYETTTYLDGTILYSNENTGNPVKVLIGGNQATQGVDEGLRGMQTGEIRKLTLPPHLSRRTTYPDNLSPDSTIVVRLELHKIL